MNAKQRGTGQDVWGYARISTPEQDEGFGLDVQREEIAQYCSNNDLNLLEIITDDCSGDLQFRPGLDRLIGNLRKGVGRGVVIHRPDRLARKSWIAEWAMDEWHTNGIVIHFESIGLIRNTPEDRFQVGIMCQVGELDKAQMLRKLKAGRRKKLRDNHVFGSGSAPFGYVYTGRGKTSEMIVEEDEAAVIRTIFEEFVIADKRVQTISDELTEQRVPTAVDRITSGYKIRKYRGFGEWNVGTIYRILKNPTYYGEMPHLIWRQGYDEVDGVRKLRRSRSLNNPDVVYVDVPPIISRELWDAAQAKLRAGTKHAPANAVRQYLVARRVECACGWRMAARTTRGGRSHYSETPYYYCNGTTARNNKRCSMPHFNARQVDTLVWDWLEKTILDPDSLAAGLREMRKYSEQREQELTQRKETILRQLADADQQMQRLLPLYLNGSFDLGMLEQQKKQLEQRQTSLKDGIKELDEELRSIGPSDEEIEDLQKFARANQQGLQLTKFEYRRQIVDMLGVHVKMVLEDGKKFIEVSCRLPGATKRASLNDANSTNSRRS